MYGSGDDSFMALNQQMTMLLASFRRKHFPPDMTLDNVGLFGMGSAARPARNLQFLHTSPRSARPHETKCFFAASDAMIGNQ